jgi:predicted butyrate kinase (DUF1464 family)
MMKKLQIIEEHLLIRNTISYELISKLEVYDIPSVLHFLNIVQNYIKMDKIINKTHTRLATKIPLLIMN